MGRGLLEKYLLVIIYFIENKYDIMFSGIMFSLVFSKIS